MISEAAYERRLTNCPDFRLEQGKRDVEYDRNFGASGDLTSRKLIPALYQLYDKGRLPESTRIVGVARREMSDETWRNKLADSTERFVGDRFKKATFDELAQRIFYRPGNLQKEDDLRRLCAQLEELEGPEASSRVYYLATSPKLYASAVQLFGQLGMADDEQGARRVVIEKPFGVDLRTAKDLNRIVHGAFDESQVYRIDHYLGKESVQNMLVLRFANSIFEPIWNRNYIDHVQITVAEEVDVEGRAGYYDGTGVVRDMFQNHLLQLMTITAMEAPIRYEADMVRDEKVKVLHAVRPMSGADFATNTIRAQYDGYLAGDGVASASQTATFAALKLHVDNWRWNGVPFYLRSGKAMSCRTTQIVIQFRRPPHQMFAKENPYTSANRLVLQVQPGEGIQLHFQTKVPDAGMKMRMTDLDFSFQREYAQKSLPDAYQRLLLDAMNGDASLFARSDEVELAWGIIDPILAAWDSPAASPLYTYERGMWGPEFSNQWMNEQGRDWFDVCPVLH